MLTLTLLLVLSAGTISLVSAGGKIPLWPAVFLLVVVHLLLLLPIR